MSIFGTCSSSQQIPLFLLMAMDKYAPPWTWELPLLNTPPCNVLYVCHPLFPGFVHADYWNKKLFLFWNRYCIYKAQNSRGTEEWKISLTLQFSKHLVQLMLLISGISFQRYFIHIQATYACILTSTTNVYYNTFHNSFFP